MPTDEQKAFEREAALARFHAEQEKKGNTGGLAGQAKDIATHPGETTEEVVRAATRIAAKGGFRLARGLFRGLMAATHDLQDGNGKIFVDPDKATTTPKDSVAANPQILTRETPAPGESWFDRKLRASEVKMQAIADDKRPIWQMLSSKILHSSLNRSIRFARWSGHTYPLVFRPIAWAPGLVRKRIDRKIEQQGHSTNAQRFVRKLFGMQNPRDNKFRFRYAAINMLTLGFVAPVFGLDALYNYGSYSYWPDNSGIHIVQVQTQSDSYFLSYKIDAYRKLPDGKRQPVLYDADWSFWFPAHLPRSMIAEGRVQAKMVCYNIRDFGYLIPIPMGLRRLGGWNQIMLHADCYPDPDQENDKSTPPQLPKEGSLKLKLQQQLATRPVVVGDNYNQHLMLQKAAPAG